MLDPRCKTIIYLVGSFIVYIKYVYMNETPIPFSSTILLMWDWRHQEYPLALYFYYTQLPGLFLRKKAFHPSRNYVITTIN